MSRPSGSSDSELSLKFLFANQDGIHVILRFPKAMLVADVKAQLIQNWPPGMAPADNAKCIRLICMGRGMLQDSQSLEASKVPGFPTHPTPVNVSVLRRPSSSAAAPAQQPTASKAPPPRAGQSARPTQTAPVAEATPGCGCTIL